MEFLHGETGFGTNIYEPGGRYVMVDRVPLEKKQNNDVSLVIVPTARVALRAVNTSDQVDWEDSIQIELKEQYLSIRTDYKGASSSSWMPVTIPHGYYTLSYWVYRNDSLDETVSHPLYLRHELDTIIEVQY